MSSRIQGAGTALLLSALLVGPAFAAQPTPADQASIAADLHRLADLAAQSPKPASRTYDERAWLQRFYGARAYAPAWGEGNLDQAQAALSLLQGPAANGLNPEDYYASALARQQAPQGAHAAATYDATLTIAVLRYLADLRVGRVRSVYQGAAPDPRLTQSDPVEQLRAALAAKKLAAAVQAAEPRIPSYQRIKSTLAQYRKLAGEPFKPLPALPLVPGSPNPKLETGGAYEGLGALRARLVQLGDLAPQAATAADTVYSAQLVEGVKRFQARHGLDPDGVLGRGTLAALNVPLSQRVRQLEMSLERLRWLPDFAPGRVIAVNLPTFRLWAFDSSTPNETPLEMRVIVGVGSKTETPLFVGSMRYLEFNPYWNVPRSIALGEVIPKLHGDAAYLAKNDMELVSGEGGEPVTNVDAETIAALGAGKYRVRQRPGAKNALGAVKFAMPNADNIYLHSTSARELFKRSRRDLSHGCIRVENPQALAQFVLSDQPQWARSAIEDAMKPGQSRTVSLKAPIPVVLFYATAITDADGRALFAEDVYKRDPLLEQALKLAPGAAPALLN